MKPPCKSELSEEAVQCLFDGVECQDAREGSCEVEDPSSPALEATTSSSLFQHQRSAGHTRGFMKVILVIPQVFVAIKRVLKP